MGVAEESRERSAEAFIVAGLHEKPCHSVLHHLGNSSDATRDDGYAAGHRLQHRVRRHVRVARQREDGRLAQEFGQTRVAGDEIIEDADVWLWCHGLLRHEVQAAEFAKPIPNTSRRRHPPFRPIVLPTNVIWGTPSVAAGAISGGCAMPKRITRIFARSIP